MQNLSFIKFALDNTDIIIQNFAMRNVYFVRRSINYLRKCLCTEKKYYL